MGLPCSVPIVPASQLRAPRLPCVPLAGRLADCSGACREIWVGGFRLPAGLSCPLISSRCGSSCRSCAASVTIQWPNAKLHKRMLQSSHVLDIISISDVAHKGLLYGEASNMRVMESTLTKCTAVSGDIHEAPQSVSVQQLSWKKGRWTQEVSV